KNAVIVHQELNKKYQPKLERYVRLGPQYANEEKLRGLLEELNSAPKQRQVILSLFSLSSTKKPIKVKELKKKSGVSSSIIKALIDKKILEEHHEKIDRVNFTDEITTKTISLSDNQAQAFTEIKEVFETENVC